MRWPVAVVVVFAVACTQAAPSSVVVPRVPTPSPPPAFLQPFLFVPEGDAAASYNEPGPTLAATAFDDAVIRGAHAIADPRLFRACVQLARLVTSSDTTVLDGATVAFVWAWNGIIEPPTPPLVLHAVDPQAVVAALGDLAAGAHLGIARHGDAIVVATTTPGLVTSPFARRAPIDGGFTIDAKLAPRFASPEIKIDWGARTIQRLEPKLQAHAFSARVDCGGRSGEASVQIIAFAEPSPTVLARFPVWCGIEPPHSWTIDPLHDATDDPDPARAAHRMFTLLQRDRAAAGLTVLAWDERAAEAARLHADDLAASVASGVPPKFRRVTIPVPSIVENMAVATSIDAAYTQLMTEPERRATPMSAELTAGGIGVATAAGQVIVSQIFVRVPGTIDARATARDLERKLQARSSKVSIDPALSEIAREIAGAMVAGTSDKDLQYLLYVRGAQLGRYAHMYFTVTTTADVASLDIAELDKVPKVDHAGIGIVQGHDPKLGDNAVFIITVVGKHLDNY